MRKSHDLKTGELTLTAEDVWERLRGPGAIWGLEKARSWLDAQSHPFTHPIARRVRRQTEVHIGALDWEVKGGAWIDRPADFTGQELEPISSAIFSLCYA